MTNRFLWVPAGIIAGFGLGWWALRGMDWAEVYLRTVSLDWRLLVLAAGSILLAGVLDAIRWKLLLPAERVSLARLFLVKHVGMGLNNLSPVRVVSDISQSVMLRYRDGVPLEKVVSSLICIRLFDLLATVSLVGVGLILLPPLSDLRPVILPVWGISLAAVVTLVLFAKRLHHMPLIARFGPVQDLLKALGILGQRRVVMVVSFALTAIAWMSVGTAAWLVATAAGIDLPLWLMAIVILIISFVSGAVPSPPGSLGVYEFTAVSTLGLFAVEAAAALTFAVVIRTFIFTPPAVITTVALVTERETMHRVLVSIREVFLSGRTKHRSHDEA